MNKNNFINLGLPEKVFGIDRSFLLLFLPPLGLFLVFLLSLNLVLMPKATEIGTVRQRINTAESSTSSINEQNKYLLSMDQEELQRNFDYLNDAVLKDKRSYVLLGVIRSVANRYNYQLVSFSLSPGEVKGDDNGKSSAVANTIQLPLSVSMMGPKENSLNLILALEKTLPILFIDKYETKKNGDVIGIDLTVHSYYISDESSVKTDNISLSDLILSKSESALVEKISSFIKIEDNQLNVGTSEFKQYERENPFSL